MSVFRKTVLVVLTFLVLTLGAASSAQAVPISFTFAGTGTGTAGNQSFTNSTFTITLTTDTTLVTQVPGNTFITQASPTTMTIAGVGSGTFVTPVRIFNSQDTNGVGLARTGGGGDILDVLNSAFATYNLQTNLGPLSVALSYNDFNSSAVITTLGTINFTSLSNLTFTAQTSAAAVPEPATMILLGTGLAGVAARVRRQRKID